MLRRALEFQRDCKEYETKAREFVSWMEKQEMIFKDTDRLKNCSIDELVSLLGKLNFRVCGLDVSVVVVVVVVV